MLQSEKDIALRRLKAILLSEDENRLLELEEELRALREQIADKESLIETLDPVIADVLDRKIVHSKEEFIEILAPVIGGSIKKQVSEAKDDIVDALYPVIGKTIRKSVAEAMKNLVNSVNERIEKSLHSINIFNLFKSKITGISQAELLLRNALPFRLQELLLFRKENGLLFAHAGTDESQPAVDQELLSGLITAIQEFAPSAFTASPKQDLYEFDYGDSNVRIDVQNNFYIAALCQGVMPADFPEKLTKLGNRIHNRFYKTIREFDGDGRPLAGIVPMLRNFISSLSPVPPAHAVKRSRPFLAYILIFLVFASVIFWGIRYAVPHMKDRQLALKVQQLIQSDTELQNENISILVQHKKVLLSGSITSIAQKTRIDSLVRTFPKIQDVTNSLFILSSFHDMDKKIKAVLLPYLESGDAEIRYIIEKDRVILEGYVADPQIKQDISRIVSDIEGVKSVINNITHVKQSETEKLGAYLENTNICFQLNDTKLDSPCQRRLCYIAAKMALMERQSLVLSGYSDNLSSPAYNLTLSRRRAQAVADYLKSKNIAASRIKIEYFGEENPIASNSTEVGRSANRRVELKLSRSDEWQNL